MKNVDEDFFKYGLKWLKYVYFLQLIYEKLGI